MGLMNRLNVERMEEAAGFKDRLPKQYAGEPKHRTDGKLCQCHACHTERSSNAREFSQSA